MYKTNNYVPTDKMSDLICGNYTLLQVMSRFDLSLGFGDQTVQEVCRANGVDCKTFLAVVNFITEENNRMADEVQDLSIHALMNYLKQAHHYFLDFQLPTIRRKLIEAIDCSVQNEVAFLILKFFDAYVAEVRKHLDYEDMNVFTYVENLVKYYPAGGNDYLLNAVLFDIFSCEQDLASHCRVEDYLFVPAVLRLEKEVK